MSDQLKRLGANFASCPACVLTADAAIGEAIELGAEETLLLSHIPASALRRAASLAKAWQIERRPS